MLPARHRMRRPADFERAVRRGARCGRQSLVVHLGCDPVVPGPVVVGFVVSKAVGNAVVRNRVKRRLRAVVSHRIDQLPDGGRLVVRALPGSGDLDSTVLGRDFDAALLGARRRIERQRTR
ncbi:ribonuclease P protein component [Pengzhenrongella sp.]|uniref:ribonuclease P protein component n=1 Tax=Pengzhenrongella sp. TaxID=2888820 RepID=UPI002F91F232